MKKDINYIDLTDEVMGDMAKYGAMTPCFTSEEKMKDAYSTCNGWSSSNFMEEYLRKFSEANMIAESAKFYILENWEKVEDWSGLEITLMGAHQKTPIQFYNKELHSPPNFHPDYKGGMITRWLERYGESQEQHNPISTFNGVVLDPSDGDFSITVNGIDFLWISYDTIITIADYIEKSLNE